MTTSFRVKFRPSSAADCEGTLYFEICRKGLTQEIPTVLRLRAELWDARSERVIPPSGEAAAEVLAVQRQLDGDMDLLAHIVGSFEAYGKKYSARDVAMRFRAADRRVTVLGCLHERIETLTAAGCLGTARNYRRACNSLRNFLSGADLPMCALGERTVASYAAWLRARGVVRNSLSFYMRILRAVYNRAVVERITVQTFPFRNVYTGVDRTRKRAVKEEVILRLRQLPLRPGSALALTRDLFIFSYCMRGMAFVDMAFLRKCDLADEAISYVRRKTGQRLTVSLEPCMREIIARHAARAAATPYLFPILTACDPREAYAQYQTALGCYNLRLAKLSALVGSGVRLSSYTSRHSWATAARDRNIPLPVISAGMGHASEKTTQIYLATLENSVIDSANRTILAALNG